MLQQIAQNKADAASDVNPESYYNCLNCCVKFNANQQLVDLYGVHCSPNCALRHNQNAFENGEIHGRIYQYVIEKIERFFDIDGIEPFPVFETFRGSIEEYHTLKPMPPGFVIAYADRRQIHDDSMDVEHHLSEC
jgi:hypothetical protein